MYIINELDGVWAFAFMAWVGWSWRPYDCKGIGSTIAGCSEDYLQHGILQLFLLFI
jgi:hypothetical protein